MNIFQKMNRIELEKYILLQYDALADDPWASAPGFRVFRHADSRKWFAVMMNSPKCRLGEASDELLEVVNVKCDPLLIGSLRGQNGYFPAYHMNKEKWLSIQLGKPELDDAIKDLLSLSYELTAPKKRNPKSSAKNPGDSANGKEKEIDEG